MSAPSGRLLVVDDVEDNRRILSRRFTKQGFEVLEADGGGTALRMLGELSFDAVLLDLMMPGIDGLSVLRTARETHSPAALPIIMVTAVQESAQVVEALRLGANDYVTKPVDFPVALARVQAQIGRKRAEDALHEANRALEQRVAERTASLVDANRQLREEIDTRRRAEKALRAAVVAAESANRAKTAFLGNISHELRTPLNAIIGFSSMIRDRVLGPVGTSTYIGYAADIHDSGAHLLQIVDNMLDLTRTGADADRLCEAEVDLVEAMRSCLGSIAEQARQGDIALDLACTAPLPALWADEALIKRILTNLLSNAVKFNPPGGRVALSAAVLDDGALAVSVADTGIGIPSAQLEQIQQPFAQLEVGLTRRYEGAGVGLATAKLLVELHGGHIEIRSQPHAGTTVLVVFPEARVRRPRLDTAGEALVA